MLKIFQILNPFWLEPDPYQSSVWIRIRFRINFFRSWIRNTVCIRSSLTPVMQNVWQKGCYVYFLLQIAVLLSRDLFNENLNSWGKFECRYCCVVILPSVSIILCWILSPSYFILLSAVILLSVSISLGLGSSSRVISSALVWSSYPVCPSASVYAPHPELFHPLECGHLTQCVHQPRFRILSPS